MATTAKAIMPPLPPGAELQTPELPPLPPGAVLVSNKDAKPEAPKEESPGFVRKAYNFMGGNTGLGSMGGAMIGAAFAPETGGLSLLIPVLGAALGGAGGAATEGKSPLKEGLTEGAMQGVFHGLQRGAKPAWQFLKDSTVKTLGSRPLVAEAAEGLLKKWLNPVTKASDLYEEAGKLTMQIPAKETYSTLDNIVKSEVERAPTEIRQQILDATKELRKYFQPTQPPTLPSAAPKPSYKVKMGDATGLTKDNIPKAIGTAAPTAAAAPTPKTMSVPELMEESQRLRAMASKAYESGNSKLANVLNSVRSAMLNDLEAGGAGVVKEAAKSYRREMALEDLGKLIAKPFPGIKIADFMRDNPLFKGAFEKGEKAQIDRIVKKLTFVAPTGGSGVLGKAITMGIGVLVGGYEGGQLGSAMGAVLGHLGPEYMRTLFASPWGRNFMERSLADVYKLGPSQAANYLAPMWAIAARGLTAPQPDDQ